MKANTKPNWIIVAGKARARVFEFNGKHVPREIFDIDNPQGRLQEHELVSDRPGRAMQYRHAQRNPLPRHHTKREKIQTDFTHVIAKELSRHKRNGRFAQLILAAEAGFLGKLRRAVAAYKNLRVESELRRDLIKIPKKKLTDSLKKHLVTKPKLA